MQKAVNCTTVWNLKRPNIYQMTIIRDLIGESNGTPLQYSCLENPMDGGAWWAAVHGVAKSRTWLRDFTFTFHFHALEKDMATRSSVLAWRIPGKGKPGGLLSVGSHRVRHDWSDLAAADILMIKLRFLWLSYRRTICIISKQPEKSSLSMCRGHDSLTSKLKRTVNDKNKPF